VQPEFYWCLLPSSALENTTVGSCTTNDSRLRATTFRFRRIVSREKPFFSPFPTYLQKRFWGRIQSPKSALESVGFSCPRNWPRNGEKCQFATFPPWNAPKASPFSAPTPSLRSASFFRGVSQLHPTVFSGLVAFWAQQKHSQRSTSLARTRLFAFFCERFFFVHPPAQQNILPAHLSPTQP